jgi:hypothetical protein
MKAKVSCRSRPAVEKRAGHAPAWLVAVRHQTHLNRAAANEKRICALHQKTRVKDLFSPWPVHDSVDNGLNISPEPRPAWLPLRCSWNEQHEKASASATDQLPEEA